MLSVLSQIIGMDGLPGVGDELVTVQDEGQARSVAAARATLVKQAAAAAVSSTIRKCAADTVSSTDGAPKRVPGVIPVLVKADVLGSLEAVLDSFSQLRVGDEAESLVDVVFSGLGDVTSSDVSLAQAVGATIFAFKVGSTSDSRAAARSAGTRMLSSRVIYELLDEAEKLVTTIAVSPAPGLRVGQLLVKKVFTLGKAGRVAGCEITEGTITSASSVLRISRAGTGVLYTGPVASIRSGKDAVFEVSGVGTECGLSFGPFTEFAEGDIIECFLDKPS
jgi:translation initiation factor IF-2